MEAQTRSIANLSMTQLETLQNQVQTLQKEVDESRDHFSSTTNELAAEFKKTIDKMKENYEKELSNAVTEANLKYNKLLVDSSKREEELKSQITKASDTAVNADELVKENMQLKQKNATLEENAKNNEIGKKKAAKKISALSSKNKQQEEELASLRQKIADGTKENTSLKADVQNLQEQVSKEKEGRETDLSNYLAQVSNIKELHKKEIFEKDEMYLKMKVSLEKENAELKNNLSKRSEMNSEEAAMLVENHKHEIEVLSAKNEVLQKEYDKMSSELNARINELQAQIREISSNSEKAIEAEKMQHSSSLSIIMKSHASEVQELKDLFESQMKEKTSQLEKAAHEYKEKEDNYKKTIDDLNNQIMQIKSEYETQISKIQKEKETELKSAMDSNDNSRNSLSKTYEKKLAALKEQYESEKKQAEELAKAQIKQLDEKYAVGIRLNNEKLNKEFEERMNQALELQRDHFENEINDYKGQLETASLTVEEAEEQCRKQMKDYEEKMFALKMKIKELEANNQMLEKTYSASIDEKVEIMKKQLEERDAYYVQKTDELKEQQANDILEIKKEFSRTMIAKQAEFANICKQNEKKIKDLTDENQSLKDQIESLKAEFDEKMKEAQEKYDKLNELIESKESEAEKEQQQTIKRLESQMEDLKRTHNFELANDRKELEKHEREKQQMKEDYEKKILSIEHQYELGKNEIELQKNAEIQNIKNDNFIKISELQKIIEKNSKDAAEAQLKFQRDLADMQSEIETRYKEDISKLKEELKTSKETRDATISDLTQKVKSSEEQIEQYKMQLKQAGSNKEDRERIKKLEAAVQERSDMVAKLFNELKHYQQEFANRELSYNKVFSAKPQVGVLNVLERRVKKDVLDRSLPPLADQIEKAEKRSITSLSARRKTSRSTK